MRRLPLAAELPVAPLARALRRVRAPLWLPVGGALGMVATIVVGLLRDARGEVLGVPLPGLPGAVVAQVHPLVALAVPLLLASAWLAPRLLEARVRPVAFALATLALTLVLRLALAAARGGTGQWTRVFDAERSFEAPNEYLPGLLALRYGVGFFLDRYAELVPSFPVHVAGHPPGLLLTMHALAVDTPAELAALCIGVGALSAPLTYALAREVLSEPGARVAGLLMTLAPAPLLYGATSADAVYLTLGLLAAWPLAARPAWARALGAAVLALASLFAWSLLGVGAWAALLALMREGWRRALALAVTCGVALLAVQAGLAALTGWDPLGTLAATEQVYRLGVAAMRPYSFWLFGSPTIFALTLGVPIAWLALRAAGEGEPAALAVLFVLTVAAVAGFTKAETERIWLFLAPLVCLAAAPVITRRTGALRPLLVLLAVQALLYELVFDTVW